MKRPSWIIYTVTALLLAFSLSLFACNDDPGLETLETDTDPVTESESETKASESESEKVTETESTQSVTDSSSESAPVTESESATETATQTESSSNTESESSSDETESKEETSDSDGTDETESETETEIDPNTVIYSNGDSINGSGDGLTDDSFALIDREIDVSSAVEISASELLSLLEAKTATKEGEVYRVKDAIILESDKKYYGNLATVIADGGIIIKDVSNVVLKELVIKGNITIEGSSGVTLFRLVVNSSSTAINASSESSDISIKNCRIVAANTAISTAAKTVSLYQNYLCADKGIVSSGDDTVAQNNRIVAISAGVSSSGNDCIFKNNSVDTAMDGVGIDITGGSQNTLVALNDVTGAQISVRVTDGYNCSVVLNRAIRLKASKNTNLYLVDNKLGGAIELSENNYLICDGNTFVKDAKPHPVISLDNTNVNGDNLHDVDARLEVGADEELLPHTNKDLFIGMERKSSVRDLSQTKAYGFNNYVRNVAKSESVVIVPPGVYSISSGLSIQAAHSNTTVYAYGVYQEATDYIHNIAMSGASKFTLKGLTVGYAEQSAGQMQVLQKLGDNKLLVIASAGFSKDFGKTDSTRFSGDSGCYLFHPGTYTSWTEIGAWGKYTVIPNENGETFNEDGTFTIQIGGSKNAAKYYSTIDEGEIFTCRLNETNDRTFSISSCTDVLLKDTVTYGYADALCFVIGGRSEGVKFYRHHNLAHSAYEIDKQTYDKYVALEEKYGVDLEVYIDSEGRYRGADPRIGSVDATHVTGSTEGLSATSTLFENACDDASNQRGNSSSLHQVIDNKDGTYTLIFKDFFPETYYNLYKAQGKTNINPGHRVSDFVAGDRIFIYTAGGKVVCDTTVLTPSEEYQKGYIIYEEDYKLNGQEYHLAWSATLYAVNVKADAFDMTALEGYDLETSKPAFSTKVIVDNLSRNSVGFTFDNCMVRHNRGRVVIKTRDAAITNCTFKDTSYAGIVMSVESTWGESSVPCNIQVTKCLFDGTSQTLNQESNTKYSAIAVEGLGSGGATVTVSEDTLPSKNISITNNVFRNVSNNYYVTVSAAQNVDIIGNIFEAREGETAKRVGKAILINGCMDVTISDNSYSSFAKGDVTKVVVANNYKNLNGTDVDGVFEKDKEPVTEAETE